MEAECHTEIVNEFGQVRSSQLGAPCAVKVEQPGVPPVKVIGGYITLSWINRRATHGRQVRSRDDLTRN